jgi:hypothetical protein
MKIIHIYRNFASMNDDVKMAGKVGPKWTIKIYINRYGKSLVFRVDMIRVIPLTEPVFASAGFILAFDEVDPVHDAKTAGNAGMVGAKNTIKNKISIAIENHQDLE